MTTTKKGKAKTDTKIDNIGSSALILRTSNGITGMVDNFQRKLKEVDSDVKMDEMGIHEYKISLDRLRRRKADLQKRIEENKAFVKYKTLVNEISSLYGEAKEKHAQGIKLLIKDFAYHPAFKRWDDSFTSIPFKPA
ncbi:hypothetical protein A3770_10p58700 [Chloropicon primus]|uniref:Uncharacterized protein n=1 Tax=Chloropicon primus TaxID=1764295 RepID=A0A5B8MV31_9CHLO|nr:hypothetical protein A3770_10p58700 [Chloropicon primus]|eukprot:QDZ23352.1 hypothetical protein A3770_10p58700 [Chloropicon primus]